MFHQRNMFAIILNSSSTSWELRNSVLPMLFQSGNVKDVSTSTSTIQRCFLYWLAFNSNMSIAPVVYIRELRKSVLPMVFHGWKCTCERRTFDFYPYFQNSEMLLLLIGLQFKHLHHLHLHENDNLPNERPSDTWNNLWECETIISWIWLMAFTHIECCNYKSLLIWGPENWARFQLKLPRQYYFILSTIFPSYNFNFHWCSITGCPILIISFHEHVTHHTKDKSVTVWNNILLPPA